MKIKTIFLILSTFCASILSAQKPCGNDIAPNPDSSIGISLGSRGCFFNAPGVDTILPELQDPTRLIEWVHQDGYAECSTGYYQDGRYFNESTWMCPHSQTSRIGLYEVANPGIVAIGGNEFYRYLPEEIKPDKNKTYNAGYGDAAPAYCGCLRRVKVVTETLYAGSGKVTPVKLRPDYNVDPFYGFSPPIQGADISMVSPDALHPIATIPNNNLILAPIDSYPPASTIQYPTKEPHTVILKGSGSVIVTYNPDGSVTLESRLKPRKTLLQKIKSWGN